MAIAKMKPTVAAVPAAVDPSQILDRSQVYKTATVDNAVTAPESLLVYLDGMPWAVDYYAQLLSDSDDIREVDIGQNAALQQYQRTKNLELRVQSELSPSFDASTALTSVKGTALIVQIVPNKYDYFVTAVGDREEGLFMVSSVNQKTYNSKTVYEIEYSLVGYTSASQCKDRYDALTARTIRTFYFHKERIVAGNQPLLTEAEHGEAIDLKYALLTLYDTYFTSFMVNSDKLLFVPSGEQRTIDPRLNNFVAQTVGMKETPLAQMMNVISMDFDPYYAKRCLWDAILDRQSFVLESSPNKVKMMPKAFFTSMTFMTGTACWAVDAYVYPDIGIENQASAICNLPSHPKHDPRLLLCPVKQPDSSIAYVASLTNQIVLGEVSVPVIKAVHTDGYYVLSEAFYRKEANLSLLEILVKDMIDNKPLDSKAVVTLANHFKHWPPMEKFYYGPILAVMIRDIVKDFY